MTAKVIYLGELRTEATHIASGNSFITDAPVDNQGKGEAFSPTDSVCAALASCMLTIMGIYCQSRNISITGASVQVIKKMAANPRRIAGIELQFKVLNSAHIEEQDKKNLEKAAVSCPVALSLHPEISQEITFEWS
jgi:putative redox protein